MGTNSMNPTPPPGFKLDTPQQNSGAPTPPPGFTLDNQGGQNSYWSDVGKNAWEGVKEIPGGVANFASDVAKTANLTSPIDLGKSALQMMAGASPEDTSTGQNAKGAYDLVRGAGQGIFQQAKDVGKAAVMPLQMAGGTPASQTMFGQAFRERPLSSTVNVATAPLAAKGLFGMAKGAMASTPKSMFSEVPAAIPESTTPNLFQVKGAQGINSTVGIGPGTVESLTRAGQNPGTIGTSLMKTLSDEGIVGKTATETYGKAIKKANQYGQEVGNAIDAIKKANQSLGVYPEMGDSLKVEANPILKPILDEANSLRDSGYPVDRVAARGLRAMYNNLSKKASAAAGESGTDWLTLDDVRDELSKVGDQLGRAGTNDLPIVKRLYGKLADIRDSMVQDIASRMSDPKLASNLMSANANYSRYMRILPDMKSAAAAEPVGAMRMGSLFDQLKNAVINGPQAGRLMMKAGGAESKAVTPEIARDLLKQSGGNRELARKMARDKGYSF